MRELWSALLTLSVECTPLLARRLTVWESRWLAGFLPGCWLVCWLALQPACGGSGLRTLNWSAVCVVMRWLQERKPKFFLFSFFFFNSSLTNFTTGERPVWLLVSSVINRNNGNRVEYIFKARIDCFLQLDFKPLEEPCPPAVIQAGWLVLSLFSWKSRWGCFRCLCILGLKGSSV